MAKSDARFGYKANLTRESHDLSRRFGFTCAPGMELPIFSDIATPGDTYYIKHDLTYLRTLPLLAPSMIDVLVHFETFFVPMQMIYQPFENVVFSLKTIQSDNFNIDSLQNNRFPLFDYNSFATLLKSSSSYARDRAESFRLADMFGLNPYCFCTDNISSGVVHWQYSPSFFPWQILAYNTITYNYYVLDDKTQYNNGRCNWDYYYSNSSSVNITDTGFMNLTYRAWDFDYFTSIYRSPIVSSVNMQRVLSSDNYSDLAFNYTSPLNDGGGITYSNSDIRSFGASLQGSYSNANVQLSLNAASIRQMFSNEKLAMITGRTKKNYDSQVLAHYGVNVPHDVKHDLTLIGHDTYYLNVGEITSLASTEQSPLGELAGKGWASSPNDVKQHKFTAPCHGVVMTLFCVEPKKRYYGGFDRRNSIVDAYDLPTPEFDRLGNMPMYRYETGTGKIVHDADDPSGTMYADDIVGWKERYYAYKRNIDRTTVAFDFGQFYARNVYSSYFLTYRPFEDYIGGTGVRPDLEDRFYINPKSLDSLFGVEFFSGWKVGSETSEEDWSVNPHLVYARDPFIVDAYPKVTKVSWMSKDGEPIYNY